MVPLSPATTVHIDALFAPGDVAEASRLLAEGCAESLPLIGAPATPLTLERIRFGVLRLSHGDLARLREAIVVAQTDWRDVLVAAGFGHGVEEHLRWQPRARDAAEF